MHKARTYILMMLLGSMSAFAGGDGEVPCQRGLVVIDADYGDPLIGVEVRLTESEEVLFSDPDGHVDLSAVDAHQGDLIRVSYISYETVEIQLEDCSQLIEVKL